MQAIFVICERIGTGTSSNPWRPYFYDEIGRYAGNLDSGWFVGNIFHETQLALDTIIADPRTIASFPIDVSGTDLAYDKALEIPPAMRGKLTAWAAQQWGQAFGQEVAANAKSRRHVAEKIMRKASGVPNADPLNGWRIGWQA